MAEHEVVGVGRADGAVRWRIPFPNSAVNSPMFGPDGNLYVPIFGMFDFMEIPNGPPVATCDDFVEDDFQGGVIKLLTPAP